MTDTRTTEELKAVVEHAVVEHAIFRLAEPSLHEDVLPGGNCEKCPSAAQFALDTLTSRLEALEAEHEVFSRLPMSAPLHGGRYQNPFVKREDECSYLTLQIRQGEWNAMLAAHDHAERVMSHE